MRRIFVLQVATIVLLLSCQKTEVSVTNLNDNKITVIGHGGMGIAHNYPMNSYPSIMRAITMGANGVEIDVQMTKDGVFVAYHDYEMSERSTAKGQIYDQNWKQISSAKYLNPVYTDYPVMRLDSLISGIPDHQKIIIILDCKNFNPDTSGYYLDTFTDNLINLIDQFELGENIYIEFKRTDIIETMQSKRDDLKIFFYGDDFNVAIETALKYDLPGITMSVHLLSADQVRTAHSLGIMVSVLNTHTRARNREAIEMNVDFIQTDMLRYLINLLKDSPHSNL